MRRIRNRRDNKLGPILCILCFISLFFMGTGYSLLSATTQITGKATLILGNLKPTNESYFTIDEATGKIIDFSENDFEGEVVIPKEVNGIAVTGIGEGVFDHCSGITSVVIQDGVTSIDDSAFSYCSSLESVTIPYGVTTIGESAFRDCYALTKIELPETVTSIADNAFREGRTLTEIVIPDSVITIGTWAFAGCSNLLSVTIGSGVTSIGSNSFSYDPVLETITIRAGSTLEIPSDRWGARSEATIVRE